MLGHYIVDTYVGFLSLEGDVCSQEAVVTSQSSKPEKQTAIIIAEEKGIMLASWFSQIYFIWLSYLCIVHCYETFWNLNAAKMNNSLYVSNFILL